MLTEYFEDLKIWSKDHAGIYYVPVGLYPGACPGNFVVLEIRKEHRSRYVGWFFVTENKLDNGAWTFKKRKCGYRIYQVTDDDKPSGRNS